MADEDDFACLAQWQRRAPVDRWKAADSKLLERGVVSKSAPDADEATRKVVTAALARIAKDCVTAPPAAFRLAVSLLQHCEEGALKFFAVRLLEAALPKCSSVSMQERRLLQMLLDDLGDWVSTLPVSDQMEWKARVAKLKFLVMKDSTMAPPPLAQSMRSSDKLAIALEGPRRMRWSASSPELLPDLLDRDFCRAEPKDGIRPKQRQETVLEREAVTLQRLPKPFSRDGVTVCTYNAWWNARQVPFHRGQPIFGGTNFKLPTPVDRAEGRAYFVDYSRCKPSTF
eukprot:TRINITY_DN18516_c0_g1_i1.p1 TRINITY_DN18516_c0_g1~~TRINITY_DN18516_c0_g1_i1.p1  ORF type:complete len:285 (+),score=69.05 TRINITY_DN18516_c0_g1_i1:72-926(+)